MVLCIHAVPCIRAVAVWEALLNKCVCRGKASVAAVASVVASVPQQTVAAVETTWLGTSELLKEAVDEGHEQVSRCQYGACHWGKTSRKALDRRCG